MSNGNVPVQIETCTLAPGSELNPQPYHANGVCGECTRCGATAVANPETESGGRVTRRKAAIKTLLAKLEADCPRPLPWGLAPRHEDRRVPRGVTVWAEERTTGRLLPVAVTEQGKLVGAWGGVALDAVVWVIPDGAKVDADAHDVAQKLADKGYTRARVGKPGAASERKAVGS